jgi:hypothetical protein
VHVTVNCVVAVRGLDTAVPAVGTGPDQLVFTGLADAVQEVAFVEDQVIADVWPELTVRGLTVIDTAGGGGSAPTVTLALALPVPPGPVHVSVKVVLWVILVITWLPVVPRDPTHCPFAGLADAVQEVAFVEDHVKVDEPPEVTEVGAAKRKTVGAGVAAANVTVTLSFGVPP